MTTTNFPEHVKRNKFTGVGGNDHGHCLGLRRLFKYQIDCLTKEFDYLR